MTAMTDRTATGDEAYADDLVLDEDGADRPRPSDDIARERSCMTCSRPFVSEGWHNRMCPRCRKLGDPMG
ncbi:MAG: hypothetical protein WD270_13830 [Acetobacterales bacterium]